MADVSMRILLAVVGSSAVNSAIRAVGSEISNLSPGMGIAAGAALGVSAAVIGIGAASVNMASDFQSSLAKVQAYAGMTAQETQDMGQQILALAPQLGEAPKALADALYMVSSAGFKGAQGLQVLREAGMTAAASNSDATVVTKALVGSLNALGLGANQSGNIMDVLNATVSQGLMTWDNYGAVIGKISGAVSVAGGSASMMQSNFVQLNSALDVYTNASVSARQASMYLNADMSLLDGKTSTLAKNAAKLGVSFNESQFKSMSFAQQLQYLNKVTDGNHDKLVALLGGNSQVANSVQFLNNHYGTLSQTIANVSGSMKNGQTTQDKFAVAQQTLAFKSQQASAAFQSLMIVLGNALLPAITKIVTWVTNGITAFTNWTSHSQTLHVVLDALGKGFSTLGSWVSKVADFFQHNAAAMTALKVVGIAFLGAFMGLIIAGFISLAIAAWSAAAGVIAATWPFLLIGAAIALVITGIVLLVTHWKQVTDFLGSVWSVVANFVIGIWNNIKNFAISIWNAIANFFMSIFTPVANFFSAVWNGIVTVLKVVWNVIKMAALVIFAIIVDLIILPFLPIIDWFKAHWAQIHAVLMAVWGAIQAAAAAVWNAIKDHIITPIVDLFTLLSGWWNRIKAAALVVWNAIVKEVQSIWNSFIEKIEGPVKRVMSILSKAWDIIKNEAADAWKHIADAIGNAFQGVVGGLKWIINQAINLINNIIHGINNISSHVGIPAIPDIPHLASGGMLTVGGLVQVGERGAETVALPAGSAVYPHGSVPAGAAGPMTIINISISTMARSQSEVNRLVDMVEQEIGRRFRNQTSGYAASNVF